MWSVQYEHIGYFEGRHLNEQHQLLTRSPLAVTGCDWLWEGGGALVGRTVCLKPGDLSSEQHRLAPATAPPPTFRLLSFYGLPASLC